MCSAPLDLSGSKFGKLTATKIVGSKNGSKLWLCECDCGNTAHVEAKSLRCGNTQSCGCGRKHGLRYTPEYQAYHDMLGRCTNTKHKSYHRYGGRGIGVCREWQKSFEAFIEDMGQRPEGMTLERIDNEGDYSPENCKWASRTEQMRNTRRTVMLEYGGETMCILDWSRKLGVDKDTLRRRVARGWPTGECLFGRDHHE